MYLRQCILFLLTIALLTKAWCFENLVYTWRGFPHEIQEGTIAIQDLKQHANQMDILSSQAYYVDEKGVVYGSLNPQMLEIAKTSHIKILPLVGNANFDRERTHHFLNDTDAQKRAIQTLLELCQKNQFEGLQIDFEGMSFLDRDAFTHFYQTLAQELHQHGFKMSIAIIPALTNNSFETDYLKGRYEGWSGVYDYEAIAKSSDFVTLMAYDQHGGITTPGPMAGITWDEAILQFAIKLIPPEKISLGIPWHSGYWYTGKASGKVTGNPLHPIVENLAYADTLRLLNDKQLQLRWDNIDKMHYVIFRNHFLYEYIFAEDADSFAAKLELVKKYRLRGISNWCLGEEDPKIWNFLEKKR